MNNLLCRGVALQAREARLHTEQTTMNYERTHAHSYIANADGRVKSEFWNRRFFCLAFTTERATTISVSNTNQSKAKHKRFCSNELETDLQ